MITTGADTTPPPPPPDNNVNNLPRTRSGSQELVTMQPMGYFSNLSINFVFDHCYIIQSTKNFKGRHKSGIICIHNDIKLRSCLSDVVNIYNERKQFYTLLETFGLVQRIDMPTYENGHLLDYRDSVVVESPVTLHQSL